MNNSTRKPHQIGALLKAKRKALGWTVKDVSRELQIRYNSKVSFKTIYGWESDQSLPRSSDLLEIIDLYQIYNPLAALTPEQNDIANFIVTPEERSLLDRIRRHPEFADIINRILDTPEDSEPDNHSKKDDTPNH